MLCNILIAQIKKCNFAIIALLCIPLITTIMSVQYRHGSDESTPDADFEPSFVRMLAPVQSPEWKVKSKGPSNVPIAYAGDHENPALLRIIPTVNVDKPWALVPIVALRPSMNLNIDENIPDVFAEVHFDAILEGAAGRLMSQQDKPYSNVIMAQYYLRRFRIAMSMARDLVRRQYTSADPDFTFPGWADRRGENRRTAL